MEDLIAFIATWEDARLFLLILFMSTFLGIIVYLVINPERSKRLETYKDIPFIDDEQMIPKVKDEHKLTKE